jgi:hypothetical protein
MNLNKLDVKNKNTNLYCIFYITIKEKRLKTDYRINTVSDRFHLYVRVVTRSSLTSSYIYTRRGRPTNSNGRH